MNALKSIGAVLAGFIMVVILSVATDFVMETLGIFPPVSGPVAAAPWMLALALAYRSAYTIIGGYVAARLSPTNPMRQVWILAGIGFVAGVGGAIAGWNLSAHWYPIALAVTGPLFVWLGGWLRVKKAGAQI